MCVASFFSWDSLSSFKTFSFERLPPKPSMRVISLNMWGKFGPYEKRWSYAQKYVPLMNTDILCLQEAGDKTCLESLRKATGLNILMDDCGQTGLAVLSRYPAKQGGLVEYKTRSSLEPYIRKFLWFEIKTDQGELLVTNTHLAWKKGDDDTRSGQASQLGAFLKGREQNVLLCGDFNCEYSSAPLNNLRKQGFKDILEGTRFENKPSWDNQNPFIQSHHEKFPDRRIDLILAHPDFLKSHPLKEARIEFQQPNPQGLYLSDHWGIVADFQH